MPYLMFYEIRHHMMINIYIYYNRLVMDLKNRQSFIMSALRFDRYHGALIIEMKVSIRVPGSAFGSRDLRDTDNCHFQNSKFPSEAFLAVYFNIK